MWILEHIEIVNDVELNSAEISDVEWLLTGLLFFGWFVRICVLVVTLPKADLAI